jgi:probable DNA metabolism protein
MIYVYDGTFAGLLTTLADVRQAGAPPGDITTAPSAVGDLFQEVVRVVTDHDRAISCSEEIAARISPAALTTIYRAFLAEKPRSEMLIYRYLELGRELGRGVDAMLAHERVAPVCRLARMVVREAHRMKGFVRFSEVQGGFYYARLEPDHNILPLIARHFVDRFHDQHWIIHDLRRGTGIIYDATRSEWILTGIELDADPGPTARELDIRGLWRRYFERIAIEERHNLRLQKSNLPLKYRRHLVEL